MPDSLNNAHENNTHHDWDYQVSNKVMLQEDDILHKSESCCEHDSWTISTVHTNVTIWVQHGTKSE